MGRVQDGVNTGPSPVAPSVLEVTLKILTFEAATMLEAVMSEAVVFGLASERIKISESTLVAFGGKADLCVVSHTSDKQVIFLVGVGGLLVAQLAMDLTLLAVISAPGKFAEL